MKSPLLKNTLFAGTDKGLYRLNSDTWEQLPIDPENTQDKTLDISALAADGKLSLCYSKRGLEKSFCWKRFRNKAAWRAMD